MTLLKNLPFTLLAGVLLIAQNVTAQKEPRAVSAKFFMEAGIEYGGDEFLKVFFTNGGDQTMRAGQGGYLAAGGQFEFPAVQQLMVRASVGIKYNTTAADNANIRLTRLPFTLIPYWTSKDDFRIGVGITTHASVNFRGDGFVGDVDFKSSAGPRVEAGYKWFGISYTSLSYTTPNNTKLAAGSFGLSASFLLNKRRYVTVNAAN